MGGQLLAVGAQGVVGAYRAARWAHSRGQRVVAGAYTAGSRRSTRSLERTPGVIDTF